MLAFASRTACRLPAEVACLVRPCGVYPDDAHAIRSRAEQITYSISKLGEVVPVRTHLIRALSHQPPPELVDGSAVLSVNILTRVPVLFGTRGPAHFSGCVIVCALYPVQCHARWSWAYRVLDVSDEQPDIVPAIADGDASRSVIPVRSDVCVVAPRHHVRPDAVQRVLRTVMLGHSVHCFCCPVGRGSSGTAFWRSGVNRKTVKVGLRLAMLLGCVSAQAAAGPGWLDFLGEVTQSCFVDGTAVADKPGPASAIRAPGIRHPDFGDDYAPAEPVAGHDHVRKLAHRCSPALIRLRARDRLVCCHWAVRVSSSIRGCFSCVTQVM